MGFATGLLGFLKSKFALYLLVAAVLAFGLYKAYDHVLQKGIAQGIAQMQPKVDAAQHAQKKAETELKTYKDSYNDWLAKSKKAANDYKAEQDKIVANLKLQLIAQTNRANYFKNNPTEVIRYVSSKAAAACVVPIGFVQLFNLSAEAVDPAALSNNPAGNVDDPSGVDLSSVAQATVNNNAEAVRLRQEVISWQTWYHQSYAAWQATVKEQQKSAPK